MLRFLLSTEEEVLGDNVADMIACSTEKTALRETQTLHAGCSRAEPKKIRPAADPLFRGRKCQNLISWRWSLPLPTNSVW